MEKDPIEKEVEDFISSNWKGVSQLWFDAIIEMEKVVWSLKTMPYQILYQAGFVSGKRTWEWICENLNLEEKSLKEKTYYTDAFFTKSGIGEIEFRKMGKERILRFKNGTYLAKKQGVVKRKVCHFIAGFIAGMTSIMIKKDCLVEEIKCFSKGDEHCDFIVKPF